MTVVSAPYELLDAEIYVDLRESVGVNLHLKCEGFNFAGSIKLRTAAGMIAAAERDGRIGSDSIIIESSSGNLGVALAAIAASKGLRFVCVTDSRCSRTTIQAVRALGGDVVVVDGNEIAGSLLGRRKAYVQERCANDPRYVCLNQYENDENWMAHYETTAPFIAKRFPDLDVVFVGTGTGGTFMGCARYFRERSPDLRLIAIDAVGSVNFGGERSERYIPGLGAAERMPLIDPSYVDAVVRVPELEAIGACRALASRGFLVGGSTGAVVGGAARWLREHDPAQRLTAVAIGPDLGDRYLDTVYDDDWVRLRYGQVPAPEPTWGIR